MIRFITSLLLLPLLAVPATAHELWIEPVDYTLAPNDDLAAEIRVGENFEGSRLSWLPNRFPRAEIWQDDRQVEVTSRLGDRPAVSATLPDNALAIIAIETTEALLTYREWEKFESFVAHKDFPNALADHKARGLPDTGFTETYTRHVKSLIAVGDGAGQDRAFGLQTEIIALTNPYTDDLTQGMRVKVEYLSEPRPDAQVEVFEKSAEGVTVFTTRTDAGGIAVIPVKSGHSYLLDAVVLRDTGTETTGEGAAWETLWAGLSFAVP